MSNQERERIVDSRLEANHSELDAMWLRTKEHFLSTFSEEFESKVASLPSGGIYWLVYVLKKGNYQELSRSVNKCYSYWAASTKAPVEKIEDGLVFRVDTTGIKPVAKIIDEFSDI